MKLPTCSICESEADLDNEGGIQGEIGIIPITLCVWCYAGVTSIVESMRLTSPDEYEDRLKDLREALVEIRDVANISEGVGFYAMLAQKALDKDDASQ